MQNFSTFSNFKKSVVLGSSYYVTQMVHKKEAQLPELER